MPRLLYVCPEYPPSRATGAIRASRFAQGLGAHGWDVTILTLRDGKAAVEAVGEDDGAAEHATPEVVDLPLNPAAQHFRKFEDWLPLGEARIAAPGLRRAGAELLVGGTIDAVMVNAPPVGILPQMAQMARQAKVPLVVDLRDPWGPCDQRGPLRPIWTKLIEGRAERAVMREASAVILNTDAARLAYISAFEGLGERSFALRNAVAPLMPLSQPPFEVFTALYAGSFGRFVASDPLMALAKALWKHGVRPNQFQLMMTAQPKAGFGVDAPWTALLRVIERVPAHTIPALLQRADLLLAVSQQSRLRIPLKTYDLLNAERPLLMFEQCRNNELRALVQTSDAGWVLGSDEIDTAVDIVLSLLDGPRQPTQVRDAALVRRVSLDQSLTRLAGILNFVTGHGPAPQGDQPLLG